MKFRHRIDGEERLAQRLAELAELPGMGTALDAAAGRLATGMNETLADAYGPLDPGEADATVEAAGPRERRVVLSGRRAWQAEFGSRGQGLEGLAGRAVRFASGPIRRLLRQGTRGALRAAIARGGKAGSAP